MCSHYFVAEVVKSYLTRSIPCIKTITLQKGRFSTSGSKGQDNGLNAVESSL